MKGYTNKFFKEIKINVLLIVLIILIISASIFISRALYDENGEEVEVDITSSLELIKYINYEEDEQSKSMIEFNLQEQITYSNDYYCPVKENSVYVKISEITDVLPTSVEVIAISSKATNGKDEQQEANYEYNAEKGILHIYAKNEANESGDIYYGSSSDYDEYEIIFYYDSNVEIDEENKNVSVPVVVRYENTNEEIGLTQKLFENEITLEEQGDTISSKINTDEIYDGYINTNITNGTEYETEYLQDTTIYISELNTDEIEFKEYNGFQTVNNEVEASESIIYKTITLNKSDILYVLGEDGYLQILDNEDNVLLEINKDYETENNEITLKVMSEINNLIFKTSKPVNKGIIRISTTKAIKSDMQDLDNKYVVTIQKILGNNVDYTPIQEATTEISVTIDNTEWTSNIQNSVNITATLLNTDNKYNLFKNPTIEIELPEHVEKVILGDSYLLNANGLNIVSTEVIEKENGKKAILVKFEGSQTNYLTDSIINGTNVVIPATIILEKSFSSVTDNINVYYSNEVKGNVEEGISQVEVGLTSIIENSLDTSVLEGEITNNIVKATSVETLKENSALTIDVTADVGENVVARDGTDSTKDVQNGTVYERQVIKYTVTITNNTEEAISGISVVGGVPEYTNYATIQEEDYSTSAMDYEYITDETVEEYTFTEFDTLEAGKTITGYYEVLISDLDDKTDSDNIKNTVVVSVENEEYDTYELNNTLYQAELEVKLQSSYPMSGDDNFAYTINVTNLTDAELENIYVSTSEFPEELTFSSASILDEYESEETGYGEEEKEIYPPDYNGEVEDNKYKFTIESLASGETTTIYLLFIGTNYEENVNEIELKMYANATVNSITYQSNENRINAYPQYVTATISLDKEGQEVNYGDELYYTITVTNQSKVNTTIDIVSDLPDGVEGIEAKYSYYDVSEQTTIKYDLNAQENTEYETVEETIDLSYKVEDQSDIDIPTILPGGQTITIEISATAGYVTEDTEVSNFVTVSGESISTVVSNIATVKILTEVDWDYISGNTTGDDDTEFYDEETKSNDEEDDDNNGNTTGGANTTNNGTSNENTSGNDNTTNNETSGGTGNNTSGGTSSGSSSENNGNSSTGTYSISGVVWLDENADGRRIADEKRVTGVVVKLFDAETNSIVSINGSKKSVTVNENGEYTFSNIPSGKYYCLFEYDTDIYTITTYQKSGVDSSVNNDASSAEVSIDGVVKNVGLTDVLTVDNSNLTNIDLGLVGSQTFDLKLEKYISKIVVVTSKNTKEYTYDNTSLAKIEISSKYIEGAEVTIEYTFVITNEGTIDGYVNEITDYLPSELIFSSENNSGWTKSSDGYLKNTSLTSTAIGAGESKTLTLYLTKYMTSSSTGTILNSAEITESNNLKNLSDIDSTPGNKNTSEDDYSSADILISVSTGVFRNTIIIIIAILVLLVLIYFIKKYNNKGGKSHKKLNMKKIPTMMIVFFTLIMVGITNSYGVVEIHWVQSSQPELYGNGSYWYCATYGAHQCAGYLGGKHYYNVTTGTPIETNRVVTGTESITLTEGDYSNSHKFVYLNSSYNMVGPFQVKSSVAPDSYSITASLTGGTSYVVCDSSGNQKTWTSGTTFTFYLKVPKSVTAVTSVTVKIVKEDAQTVSVSYQRKDTATFSYMTGEHQNVNGVTVEPSTAQDAYRTVTYYATETNSLSTSYTFGAVYSGSLIVKKYNQESGGKIPYESVYTVTDSKGHVITTTLKNDEKLSGLPPDTYTVTENTAPYGYDLSLQVEANITKTSTVTANATTTYQLYNSKYTDIYIKKTDESTGESIEGIGFTIYDNYFGQYVKADGSKTSTKTTIYTDSNGEIYIKNILLRTDGTFTVTEVDSKNSYYEVEDITKTKTGLSNAVTEYVAFNIVNTKSYNLTIEKNDANNGSAVDALFYIKYEDGTYLTSSGTYTSSPSTVSTSGGSIQIFGIQKGTYNIYEVGISTSGYVLSLQDGYDSTNKWIHCGSVTVGDDNKGPTVTITNKLYTNIQINKIDEKDGSAIQGIGFSIYDNHYNCYIDANGQQTSTKTILYTDSNGKIEVSNIELYEKNATFTISEEESNNLYYSGDTSVSSTLTAIPNGTATWSTADITNTKSYNLTLSKEDQDTTNENLIGYFYIQYTRPSGDTSSYPLGGDGEWLTANGTYSSSPSSIEVATSGTTISGVKKGTYHIYEYQTPTGYDITQQEGYDATNKWVDMGTVTVTDNDQDVKVTLNNKKWIRQITGLVWVDNPSGKANSFNYYYDSGDILLSGITVQLVRKSDDTVIQSTTTNSNGLYTFTFSKQILYWDLQNYVVRFKYDNENYTVVPVNLEASSVEYSRAMENYDWSSDVYAEGTGYAITTPNASSYSNSIAQYYNESNYTIETINLGVMKKIEEEFSIIENLDKVQIKRNNYSFEYTYGDEAVIQEIESDTRENLYDSVAIQNTSRTFTQYLYPSDIAYNYSTESASASDEFEVYVTYDIAITNTMNINFANLYVEKSLNIQSLSNTYSDIYELADSNWTYSTTTSDGQVATYNNVSSIGAIESGNTANVSITFKVTEYGLRQLMPTSAEFNADEVFQECNTMATARGYHIYDKNDYSWQYITNTYAQVNQHNTKGTERTSGALTLILKLREQRTISGSVFEDTQTQTSQDNNTRLGNGIYDDGENALQDVVVELVTEDNKVAKLYNTTGYYLVYDATTGLWKFEGQDAITTVASDGTYYFEGVIPGVYYLKFTYGNGTVVYTDTDGNVISMADDIETKSNNTSIDIMYYKSTILTGEAADSTDSNWYLDVEGGTNSIATDILYFDSTGTSSTDIITMRTTSSDEINYTSSSEFSNGTIQASSAAMDIQFEFLKGTSEKYNYDFKNNCSGMSFGIIERAHTEIDLEKTINNVKLTLSNGTTLINGNPNDSNISKYLTNLSADGSYAKVEMDTTYLHGSTVLITYQLRAINNSELDYATENYYKYGTIETTDTPVATAVNKIIDYTIDNNCSYTDTDQSDNVTIESESWYSSNKTTYFTTAAIDANKQYNSNLLVTSSSETLLPASYSSSDSSTDYTLTVSKLISSSDENMGWESYSEIIAITNATFTGQYTNTSGNYNAGDIVLVSAGGTSEADNAEAIIAITPTTGENRSYTIYIIAGAILIALSIGIILIRKFAKK